MDGLRGSRRQLSARREDHRRPSRSAGFRHGDHARYRLRRADRRPAGYPGNLPGHPLHRGRCGRHLRHRAQRGAPARERPRDHALRHLERLRRREPRRYGHLQRGPAGGTARPGRGGLHVRGHHDRLVGCARGGPRERDHRRRAAQLLHGRAGGGHRRRHLQRGGHEHRGAHLHRRGLLRPSGLRPFHRCGHGGRDRRGRRVRCLHRRVPHAERRDQHPAGGRGRRGAVPRRARGAAHGHAALHGRFQRLLHLDDVLRPGRGAGGGRRGGLRVAHLQRL